jgi:hypothetical protein
LKEILKAVDPMSLTVSCTVNVSVEEVSFNSVEKAMLRGTKEAGLMAGHRDGL